MSEAFPKPGAAAGRGVVARWRILAQQRLDHLTELYESGRWKLYHTESDFLAMVHEARTALKVWQDLAPPDPAFDKPIEVAIAQTEEGVPGSLPKPGLLNRVQAQYDFRKS
ncbi:TIGR03809 family protein [[Pseudomonas] carboxydohydrogena]|uniref:TIGR03809 family protein n=1 Tax=Afipia carboxydohydrogena TaxID=290 RepID=A0ABY8BKS8_AFICR|nr:TIGR03809 family protein [[Pseudomonas] carboxydohydrogena]WEF50585.1 TIGR03809 family protein [[Pseudomonas] carboxydohydrogena]